MKRYVVTCLMIWLFGSSLAVAGVGSPVPNITLPLLSNEAIKVNFPNIKSRYYLVDFWASWCASCKESMAGLSKLSKSLGPKGFKVVGISLDKDPKAAKQFLSKYPSSFSQLIDTSGQSATQFGLTRMPTSYLIGPDKKVIGVFPGYSEGNLNAIRQLVK